MERHHSIRAAIIELTLCPEDVVARDSNRQPAREASILLEAFGERGLAHIGHARDGRSRQAELLLVKARQLLDAPAHGSTDVILSGVVCGAISEEDQLRGDLPDVTSIDDAGASGDELLGGAWPMIACPERSTYSIRTQNG